jgi:hypothetical protein
LNRLRRQVSFDRLLARLLTTYSIAIPQWPPTIPSPAKVAESMQVDREERARKRIALFPSLFHGREDVYARRWESAGGPLRIFTSGHQELEGDQREPSGGAKKGRPEDTEVPPAAAAIKQAFRRLGIL